MTQRSEAREGTVRAYVAALGAADLDGMLALFEAAAHIESPLRGRMPAAPFYRDLFHDTRRSVVRLRQVMTTSDGRSAAAELAYDWTLADGKRVEFDCVDVFRFGEGDQIASLRIYYDPAGVRPAYEAARARRAKP